MLYVLVKSRALDLSQQLGQCVKEEDDGKQRLTITLPNRDALDDLAKALARLLTPGE